MAAWGAELNSREFTGVRFAAVVGGGLRGWLHSRSAIPGRQKINESAALESWTLTLCAAYDAVGPGITPGCQFNEVGSWTKQSANS